MKSLSLLIQILELGIDFIWSFFKVRYNLTKVPIRPIPQRMVERDVQVS